MEWRRMTLDGDPTCFSSRLMRTIVSETSPNDFLPFPSRKEKFHLFIHNILGAIKLPLKALRCHSTPFGERANDPNYTVNGIFTFMSKLISFGTLDWVWDWLYKSSSRQIFVSTLKYSLGLRFEFYADSGVDDEKAWTFKSFRRRRKITKKICKQKKLPEVIMKQQK